MPILSFIGLYKNFHNMCVVNNTINFIIVIKQAPSVNTQNTPTKQGQVH